MQASRSACVKGGILAGEKLKQYKKRELQTEFPCGVRGLASGAASGAQNASERPAMRLTRKLELELDRHRDLRGAHARADCGGCARRFFRVVWCGFFSHSTLFILEIGGGAGRQSTENPLRIKTVFLE